MEARTSTEVATEKLREAILSGALFPGEKLLQSRLAELLGISRTPLRTALTTLSQAGLVSYTSNRGFHVREFSFSEVEGAFAMRAELEAMACRLAATHITKEASDFLFRLVVEGDFLLEPGLLLPENLSAYRHMNVSFHTEIIRLARNPWIARFIENLQNVPIASDRIIIWRDFKVIQRSHDDHHRIAHALSNRQGDRAAAIMNEHITFALEHLKAQLELFPQDFLRISPDKPLKKQSGSKKTCRRPL